MAKRPDMLSPKRILVPVKGEAADEGAFRLACHLARESRGRVFALYVIEVSRQLPVDAEVSSETSKGEAVLQRFEELGEEEDSPVEAGILQAREVGPAVVQEALERDADLIVVGLPYKRRYGAFTMGATVPYILKNAPCPVLVWREPLTEFIELRARV